MLAPGFFLPARLGLYAFWILPLTVMCYYLGMRGGYIAALFAVPFFLWHLRLVLLSGREFNLVLTVYFGALAVFALFTGLLAEKIIRYAEALIKVAVTDELTGLYDPRFFAQCLEREVDRARRYRTPLSIVLVGLDTENTTTTAAAARLLEKTARVSDTIGHFDRGEFAVILPQTTAANAKLFCDRARQALEGVTAPVFGIVQYERPQSGGQMLEDARRKLYVERSSQKTEKEGHTQ